MKKEELMAPAGASVVVLPAIWKHLGGGCNLECGDGLSCDDDYEEAGTRRRMRFHCTPEAHFSFFPQAIRDMDAFLVKLMGRRDIRVGIPPAPRGDVEDAALAALKAELESCRSRLSTAEKERDEWRASAEREASISAEYYEEHRSDSSALEKALGALRAAVEGLSGGACYTCGAEPGCNIDCPGCRWITDAEAVLADAHMSGASPDHARAHSAECGRQPAGSGCICGVGFSGGAHVDGPKAPTKDLK